jgi:hypothetical protein
LQYLKKTQDLTKVVDRITSKFTEGI